MGGTMCDKETRNRFRFNNILQGIILAVLAWVGMQLVNTRDFVLVHSQVHDTIPSAEFFNKKRWGYEDQIAYQKVVAALVNEVHKETEIINRELIKLGASINSHQQESIIWKNKILELERRTARTTP